MKFEEKNFMEKNYLKKYNFWRKTAIFWENKMNVFGEQSKIFVEKKQFEEKIFF